MTEDRPDDSVTSWAEHLAAQAPPLTEHQKAVIRAVFSKVGGVDTADEEYLTVAEVAAMWHCDRETVYAAIYAEKLPWIDMRSPGASRARIRVRRSAAHQYMADRERG